MVVREHEKKLCIGGTLGALALILLGSCAPIQKDLAAHQSTSNSNAGPPPELVININKDGSNVVDGKTLDDAKLSDLLAARIKARPDQAVIIRVDENSVMKYFAHVAAICKNAHVNTAKLVYVDEKS